MPVTNEMALMEKEYNSRVVPSSPLDDARSLCLRNGWMYPVVTGRPTRFGFHDLENQRRVFIHSIDGLVVLPRTLEVDPRLILEALAYVTHVYDAREAAAVFHRNANVDWPPAYERETKSRFSQQK